MGDLFQKYRPSVAKRTLFLIAAFAWTFAGVLLIIRGTLVFSRTPSWPLFATTALGAGLFLYVTIFSRISMKHISRITNLTDDDHCIFAFFPAKSYLLMILMISAGIFIRHTSYFSPEYMATIYNAMGMPLLISARRFYRSFRKHNISV